MEELLVVLIQFLFEVVGQALLSVPFDFCPRREYPDYSRAALTIVAFAVGVAFGAASVALVPHSYLPYAWLRIASLVASPLLAGAIAWCVAELRISYKPFLVPRHHFWYAFTVTLGLSLVRFAYVKH